LRGKRGDRRGEGGKEVTGGEEMLGGGGNNFGRVTCGFAVAGRCETRNLRGSRNISRVRGGWLFIIELYEKG